MFKNAIVRQPGKSLADGISSANLGLPDYKQALIQHHAYVEALQYCGLEVTVLEASELFADAVFVEDVALLTKECAILTNPGAPTRKGEVALMRQTAQSFYTHVYEIDEQGCVEAGDIMMVGSHFYVGLSDRTDIQGSNQLIKHLEHHGMTGSLVQMNEFLHLKTGLSYLENNNLLVSGEFIGREEFQSFNQIIVDESEQYAANSVWINDYVLVPAGHPETAEKIKHAGYEVIELQMSEFQKLDGGLSCLSLRF